ncbi:DUF294 nucleotidyltransferase-like domain-containing protein [Corynebacterium anserum]|uniref:CBS domain-containing protein n=1 Tax=Corynebacterium anserum TaxID=2684406 RepID=A0A7G7YP08_9CORY|nr:DUF294 nucleotidyltransferase-like domain-containing protein [Corynebacterium anserum]MBC2681829.1 CBS domain-containing protein [Corynebacterium anserum]QNH96228.1 CBS domain-containing protein [Corynebacterium anserum]
MNVELDEVYRFLGDIAPFQSFDEATLSSLPSKFVMRYVRRGETLVNCGDPNDYLYVLRSGAVDVLDDDGLLLDRRESGRSFAYSTLVGENRSNYTFVAVEDSLVLMMHRDDFEPFAKAHPEFARYYSGLSARMQAVAQQIHQESFSDVLRTKLGAFAIKNPAHIAPDVSVQKAAEVMGEINVSSLLIIDGGTLDGQLRGIVTDRDMRKAVAKAVNIQQPVSSIMTTGVRTASSDELVIEAMLTMAELNIHHIPVVDGGVTTGIITSADIMRLLQANPLYFTGDLGRKKTPEEMREVYEDAQQVAVRFIERGAAAAEITSLMTVVADSMARRLLVLAEEKLGPPPVPYAFVVLGSQGRREMGLASDQDNALVISDQFDATSHSAYFAELSEYVCQGLAAAGQPLCPGEMMASNPDWRMTVSQWSSTFHNWITAPEPDALLYAQTFFDMRPIHGDYELAERVHAQAVSSAQNAPRLHAHLAALAARREPPLGFFRGLVVDRSGEYRNTLNVKKGGTAAVVQMGRLFAIAGGRDVLGTRQRIEFAAGGPVSERSAKDLIAAFDFLNSIILRHQGEMVRAGKVPDYHIAPHALSKMDREHLRDAFQIIKGVQSALNIKYPIRSI